MKKYKELKIQYKALILVLIVVVLGLSLYAYTFSSIFKSQMGEESVVQSQRSISNIERQLNDYFDEIASIAKETNYDYYLQKYLQAEVENETGYSNLSTTKKMQDYQLSTEMFADTLNRRTDISTIMIFGKKNLLLYKTMYSYSYIIKNFTKYPWYIEAMESEGTPIILGPQSHEFLEGNNEETISVSRAIMNAKTGENLGVILIDLNRNKIADICNSVYGTEEGRICLINQEGELIYEQDEKGTNFASLENDTILKNLHEELVESTGDHLTVSLGTEKYQVVYQTMEKTGWKILSLTPYSIYENSVRKVMNAIIIGFIVLLLFMLIILHLILGKIVEPITALKATVDQADGGSLKQRAEVISKDEIGELATSFNQMLDRIENLKEQVILEQENKRKFEFEALQAQINPHFLYNTLDSIIWMAECGDNNVVPMTEALAKLFRISLNKGKEMITVTEELEHVKNYLIIQSMRYLDKFDYHIQIDEDVKDLQTIKLIVQPIVENCIYHGIKKKRGKGTISIWAFRNKNFLKIKVSDDGIGMNNQMCKQILCDDTVFENASGSGIGVKNVNERIKLLFDNRYGLLYESVLGEGTIVTITLPIVGGDS